MSASVMSWQEPVPLRGGRLRRVAPPLALLLLIAFAAQSYLGAGPQVQRRDIQGDFSNVLPTEIQAVVSSRLRPGFFALDLERLRLDIEALPWVARARVDRAWPNTLSIEIWEHQALAQWGESALLSADGSVFLPSTLPAGLPLLAGPSGSQAQVQTAWKQLAAALETSLFQLVGLRLDARDNWLALTEGGIELRLGRGDPLMRLPVLLGPAQRALQHRLDEVAYIDLRHDNGFAVGWRPPAEAAKESSNA